MNSILLVEDDEIIAAGLKYALQQQGYAAQHCADAASACRAIVRKFSAQIILAELCGLAPEKNRRVMR